jgi:hypothetical protein
LNIWAIYITSAIRSYCKNSVNFSFLLLKTLNIFFVLRITIIYSNIPILKGKANASMLPNFLAMWVKNRVHLLNASDREEKVVLFENTFDHYLSLGNKRSDIMME